MVTTAPSPPSQPEAAVLRFGAFELDLRDEELRRGGVQVRLQAQPFKVLALLAQRPGELVRREEIQEHVWGSGTHVDFEQGINVCIGQIRQALGDQAQAPRFLETVRRKGYRFVAPVERVLDHVPGEVSGEVSDGPRETVPSAPASPAVPATSSSGAWPSPTEDPGASRRGPRSWPPAWWVAGAVGLLVTVAAVTGLLVWGEGRPSAGGSDPATGSSAASAAGPVAGSVPRLLVLPFEHYGSEQEGGHLADGLTEEVITELVRGYGARLGVIARTTAMRYRGTSKSVAEIAAELGVDWVVEGSVRRDGDRVRVTAQLVGADDLHRWANEYDRELRRERLADLELQATVSETIARAVALNLGLEGGGEATREAPGTSASPTVPEAHQAYLEGLGLLPPGAGADPSRALAAFRRTVELDPGFAAGWLGVAAALGSSPQPRDRKIEERRVALERALALDESLPDAHRRLALLRFYYDWDLAGARASWERALELAPHFAEAHHDLAAYWSVTGRHDQALASVDRALALDPGSPGVTSDVGCAGSRLSRGDLRRRLVLVLRPPMGRGTGALPRDPGARARVLLGRGVHLPGRLRGRRSRDRARPRPGKTARAAGAPGPPGPPGRDRAGAGGGRGSGPGAGSRGLSALGCGASRSRVARRSVLRPLPDRRAAHDAEGR